MISKNFLTFIIFLLLHLAIKDKITYNSNNITHNGQRGDTPQVPSFCGWRRYMSIGVQTTRSDSNAAESQICDTKPCVPLFVEDICYIK